LIYILKFFIRLALSIFCKEVHVKNKHLLDTKGPLFIIANHPNSFLDAIIIGAYYNRRVYFLARGDVFEKKVYRFFLNALNIIPVYRLREGKEFLHLNDYAIRKSIQLISEGESVLIFIEGVCVNDHQLQPFKKGTARILEGLHQLNVFPIIHIAGIGYNNFRGIGKKVNLIITQFLFDQKIESAHDRVAFNNHVCKVLNENILVPTQKTVIHKNFWYFFHKPYFKLIHRFVDKKTKGSVFYDSVLFALLFFTYPIFLFILFIILSQFNISTLTILIILIAIPLLSKSTIS
jgi:1-acyl-sn-glycerol-3-phosphate acyltransferase